MQNLQKDQQATQKELMEFKSSFKETNRLFFEQFEFVKRALGIQAPAASEMNSPSSGSILGSGGGSNPIPHPKKKFGVNSRLTSKSANDLPSLEQSCGVDDDTIPRVERAAKKDPPPKHTRMGKIDFPTFDGFGSVKGWIFQCNQFFRYHDTHEIYKSQIASMYMKGKALLWLEAFMQDKEEWPDWDEFCHELCIRFDLSASDMPMVDWRDVVQTGSVVEYQEEFEKIRARVKCPEYVAIGMFVGGLKGCIKHAVINLKPQTLGQDFRFAKTQETNVIALLGEAKLAGISFGRNSVYNTNATSKNTFALQKSASVNSSPAVNSKPRTMRPVSATDYDDRKAK